MDMPKEGAAEPDMLIKDAENVPNKGYRFSIPLAAKEASDTIAVKMFDGQGNPIRIKGGRGDDYTKNGVEYTLMKYFTWLESEGPEHERAIGAAAKDYCAAAQLYFGYNADSVSVSSAVDAVSAETLSDYAADREGSLPAGVSINGISAMLESDNTLRLYLNFKEVDPSDFSYEIDGTPAVLHKRSDGMRYLALDTGVYSNKLQETHTYSISDSTSTYTITASVLTYARSCAIRDDRPDTMKNLGMALYLYNDAAVKRFGD